MILMAERSYIDWRYCSMDLGYLSEVRRSIFWFYFMGIKRVHGEQSFHLAKVDKDDTISDHAEENKEGRAAKQWQRAA